MLSSCRRLLSSFVLHLAPSLLVLNSRGAKVGMRTYHGVDGRMLFTYAQLSPRRKEGSEEVERTMWKATRKLSDGRGGEEGGEAKVHCDK